MDTLPFLIHFDSSEQKAICNSLFYCMYLYDMKYKKSAGFPQKRMYPFLPDNTELLRSECW